MAEQLNLLNSQFLVWQIEKWDWPEINQAVLKYKERTGDDAQVVAYRAGDRARLRPLFPDRFTIRFWECDGPQPSYIWLMSERLQTHYQSLDRTGASAIRRR